MSREKDAADLVADIAGESADTIKLLTMLRVFCNLEERDMQTSGEATLADAAAGISVLMGDLADRVEAIQTKVDQLYELWPEESAARWERGQQDLEASTKDGGQ